MLIWLNAKRGITFRLPEELNWETLLGNYFPKPKLHRGNSGWDNNINSKLYYDPAYPSAFSTFKKIQEAAKQSKLGKNPSEIISWLEMQDSYKLHKPLIRKFPRNTYNVNNLLDVWQCELLDVLDSIKFNYNYKYLLTGIDVFPKFLHIVPLKLKTSTAVTSTFKSILKNPKYSLLLQMQVIWVRTYRGK